MAVVLSPESTMKMRRPVTSPEGRPGVPAASRTQLDVPQLGRGRRFTVRLFAILGLLSFSFMLVFVLNDAISGIGTPTELVPPGSAEARIGAAHPGEAVHIVGAAAALAIGVTGLVGLVLRPQRAGSATHAGLAAAAWVISAAVVGDPDNHGGQAGPIDVAFVVLALPPLIAAFAAAPWRTWVIHRSVRPTFLAMGLLGAPWLWYGFENGLMQRNTWPPMADPHHQVHWFVMSLVALAVLLTGAGGALPGRGWRVATTASGAAALALATASLVTPDAASALAPAWAAAAAIWGVTMLFLTWRAGAREVHQ